MSQSVISTAEEGLATTRAPSTWIVIIDGKDVSSRYVSTLYQYQMNQI